MQTRLQIGLFIALFALPAFAEESPPADCSSLEGKDLRAMDLNDPTSKALHDKCMAQMKHDDTHRDAATHHGKSETPGMGTQDPSQSDSKSGK